MTSYSIRTMLNLIGDWNPQLLRELKGQLKPLKILMAIAIAIIGQIIFLLIMMSNVPDGLLPRDLTVTTYPEIYLGYSAPDDAQVFAIESLYYKLPLDHTPDNDGGKDTIPLNVGDRITAIDGESLVLGQAQGSAQDILSRKINKPFAGDLSALTNTSVPNKSMAAMSRLRQAVPGTSVTATVEKADGRVVDVTLPYILVSRHSNSYCLVPEGWGEGQPHLNSPSRYASSSAPVGSYYQDFCQVTPGQNQYKIDWSRWHQDGFWVLSLATIFPLLILGGYSIINNLIKEERDGTLNFIRLSPRSAWDILSGKIIGVPALIYGTVLLTLPLNLIHGLMGGVPMGMLLSFYGATVLLTFIHFSFAVLVGLIPMGLGAVQAWLGAGAIFLIQLLCLQAGRFAWMQDQSLLAWGFLFTPFSMLRPMGQEPFVDYDVVNNIEGLNTFSWFNIPLVPLMVFVFLVVNSVVLGHWAWKVLGRRFFMPTGTIISKAQSYGLTLLVNICLVGFSWQSIDEPKSFVTWGEDHLILFAIAQMILWVLLVIALAPQQQSLQDWARYRHRMPALLSAPTSLTYQNSETQKQQGHRPVTGKPLSLWMDLVWGDKSPMVVAIALNLLMSMSFTLVWMFHHTLAISRIQTGNWMIATAVVLTACCLIMLIGTTLAQYVFLYRQKYAMVIALAVLTVLIAGPPIALSIAGFYASSYPTLWLTAFPWGTLADAIPTLTSSPTGLIEIFAVLTAQGGCLGLLNWFLTRQFRTIGESDTKALLREAQLQGNALPSDAGIKTL